MSSLEQLAAELSFVWPEYIRLLENKFRTLAPEYGAKTWEDRFINRDPSQATQDQTKATHELKTHCLDVVCQHNDIPLSLDEGDGYDWVYGKKKIPIEQKTRTMLFNGSTFKRNNVNRNYGVFINSWTGARSAAVTGTKVDSTLLIGSAIDGNQIPLSFGGLLSLSQTRSNWKAGKSESSGYGTLRISNHSEGSYCVYGGFHQTPTSAYALLEEVH